MVALREWVRNTAWWKEGGVMGSLGLVMQFLHSDLFTAIFVAMAIICFGMGVLDHRARRRGKPDPDPPFDMPIREAIKYLQRSIPHSYDSTGSADRKAFAALHEKMGSGELPVVGARRDFQAPRRISRKECQNLKAVEVVVPRWPLNPAAPEGVRFSLVGIEQSRNVEYRNLRVHSRDVHRIWGGG